MTHSRRTVEAMLSGAAANRSQAARQASATAEPIPTHNI